MQCPGGPGADHGVGRGQDEASGTDLTGPLEQSLGNNHVVGERALRVLDRAQDLGLGRHVRYGPGARGQSLIDDGGVTQVPEHQLDVVVAFRVAAERLGGTAVHRHHVGPEPAQGGYNVGSDEP